MMQDRYKIEHTLYPYARSADQDAPAPVRHPIVIVGGGPVGLALALDLGLKDVPVVLLDDHEGAGAGSRAICFAKRTLEICDRLGAGQAMVDKGVVWSRGKVFRGDSMIFDFDLLPEDGHRRPAFINLQQPYFEKFLVDRIRAAVANGAPIDIRGRNRVHALVSRDDGAALEIETPEGEYRIEADWLIACDGARSPVRGMMGLGFEGRVFEDNFLIADVRMTAPFPTERWFWFDPPFNPGQSALLHRQPDDVWRLDFQLGWDIDRAAVVEPDAVIPRVAALLGPEIGFELEWVSVYTFQCCTMERYRHGRVLFAGDAAHQVSPFGARGANGGVQDADNLGWKLALVLNGSAPETLLDTYNTERRAAAEENILNSTRATDFLTPKSAVSVLFRDAVLDLAGHAPFARALVNSGRLSVPAVYDGSVLNGPDAAGLPRALRPGAALVDAPVGDAWLSGMIGGQFQVLAIDVDVAPVEAGGVRVDVVSLTRAGAPEAAARYLGTAEQAVYLFRPDQHVAARWIAPEPGAIEAALLTAMGV